MACSGYSRRVVAGVDGHRAPFQIEVAEPDSGNVPDLQRPSAAAHFSPIATNISISR
jgi:hypothetical protein